jgi:two-component system sensor histidine kinase/response regulator
MTAIEPSMLSVPVPQEFRGRRILVAEDNAFNRTIISQWLAMAGIEVVLAGTGGEACSALVAADPDLVFMDVRMPDMDGIEATRHIRKSGFSKPIVGLSAATSNADQTACLDAGMNDFLAKPIDADELWGCLTRWLQPCGRPEADARTAAASSGTEVETRFLGNAGSLARAREAFIACHRDDCIQLRNMLAEGDCTGMANLAHALKGSAATIGLEALSKLALALEKKIQMQADTDEVLQLINWIDNQLAHLVESR